MKRAAAILLALVLMLPGCQASGNGQSNQIAFGTMKTTLPETTGVTTPQIKVDETFGNSDVAIAGTGKVRVDYAGNYNSVRYVTEASNLPNFEELSQYDEAWFQSHALVLVTETVTSGSIQVGIASIRVEDGRASVTLSHELDGNGTDDMATWLLWAEVETGLDYDWELANPALQSNAEKY